MNFPVDETFRNPTWFSRDEAELAVKEGGRGHTYAEQLRGILRWSCQVIEEKGKNIKYLAGVIALRSEEHQKKQVLLITSKDQREWVIPKGVKEDLESFSQAAIREALEEAGIEGDVDRIAIGEYEYSRLSVNYVVKTYVMNVKHELDHWEEDNFRKREWFDIDAALKVVHSDSLRVLIKKAVSAI